MIQREARSSMAAPRREHTRFRPAGLPRVDSQVFGLSDKVKDDIPTPEHDTSVNLAYRFLTYPGHDDQHGRVVELARTTDQSDDESSTATPDMELSWSPETAATGDTVHTPDTTAVMRSRPSTNASESPAPKLGSGGRWLRTDICDLGDAVQFVNMFVVPGFFIGRQLPMLRRKMRVDPEFLSNSARHVIVVLSLNVKAMRNPEGPGTTSGILQRFYLHKGLAVEELNRNLTTEGMDIHQIYRSIWSFLFVELCVSMTPDWKPHMQALQSILQNSSNMVDFFQVSRHTVTDERLVPLTGIVSNTVSPASQQLAFFSTPAMMHAIYQSMEAAPIQVLKFPCPLSLLLLIIQINSLRLQFYENRNSPATCQRLRVSVVNLLFKINDLSFDDWIDQKDAVYRKEWALLAKLYHSSVAIYATASLAEGPGAPVNDAAMDAWVNTFRVAHRQQLFEALEEATVSPLILMARLWPSLVAGFEAGRGTDEECTMVDRDLTLMSRNVGSCKPLRMRNVLRRFWQSGQSEWEQCFDQANGICP